LLGLKGTMSEAELHVLRARLQGGILSKARRGEPEMRPPVGLVYNSEGAIVLDPDQQVQHCLRWLFETFRRTRSVTATARAARQQGWHFRDAAASELTKGSCCGPALITAMYCASCTTRHMPVPSSTAAPIRARPSMAVAAWSASRGISGTH
jgi:hypothetical protein